MLVQQYDDFLVIHIKFNKRSEDYNLNSNHLTAIAVVDQFYTWSSIVGKQGRDPGHIFFSFFYWRKFLLLNNTVSFLSIFLFLSNVIHSLTFFIVGVGFFLILTPCPSYRYPTHGNVMDLSEVLSNRVLQFNKP